MEIFLESKLMRPRFKLRQFNLGSEFAYQTKLKKMCKGNVHLAGIFLLEKEVDQGSLETVVYVVRSQSRDNEPACRCSK